MAKWYPNRRPREAPTPVVVTCDGCEFQDPIGGVTPLGQRSYCPLCMASGNEHQLNIIRKDIEKLVNVKLCKTCKGTGERQCEADEGHDDNGDPIIVKWATECDCQNEPYR